MTTINKDGQEYFGYMCGVKKCLGHGECFKTSEHKLVDMVNGHKIELTSEERDWAVRVLMGCFDTKVKLSVVKKLINS